MKTKFRKFLQVTTSIIAILFVIYMGWMLKTIYGYQAGNPEQDRVIIRLVILFISLSFTSILILNIQDAIHYELAKRRNKVK